MGKIANAIREGVSLPVQKQQQMLALDREFVELESKVKILEAENLNLKAQVNPLKQEIERLKNEIKQKSARVHDLSDNEIDVLKALGAAGRGGLNSPQLEEVLGMHQVRVELALSQLVTKEYITRGIFIDGPVSYFLDHKGNAYLVEKNLLPGTAGRTEQPSNPNGYPCDHCGSTRLKRIGTKPNLEFGGLGIKDAIFRCLDCNKESAIEQPAP